MAQGFLTRAERIRQRRTRRTRWYFFAAIALVILLGALYLVRVSPLFKIKSRIISGASQNHSEIMRAASRAILNRAVSRWLGADNMLAWPSRLVVAAPAFAEVSVTKQYLGGTLILSVRAPSRYGIWCVAPQPPSCWWFDREGRALEPALDTRGALILRVEDNEVFVPAPGEPLYDPEGYAALKKIFAFFENGKIPVDRIVLDRRTQEVAVETLSGTRLIWSTRFIPPDAFFSFLVAQKNEGKLEQAEYADFTIEGRVYMKPR